MSTTVDETKAYRQLRDMAESQLHAGTTPTAGRWSVGVDALRLLHRLSSNPDSADDALKLLHELQVHQVELDLQNEEFATNEQELVEDLSLYQTLYHCAPMGYFVVDIEGAVIQGNSAAAELFGVRRNDFKGQLIGKFLIAPDRLRLLDLLQRVAESGLKDSCLAETDAGAQGGGKHIQFLASTPPGRENILLACCECASTNSPQ